MTDAADGGEDVEAPVEEQEDEMKNLLLFGKYFEAQHSRPWEQWTFREKANYCMDRVFLGFLAVCLLVFFGEMVYKVWYVTNVKKMAEFVSEATAFLFDWLVAQERHEEMFEL